MILGSEVLKDDSFEDMNVSVKFAAPQEEAARFVVEPNADAFKKAPKTFFVKVILKI